MKEILARLEAALVAGGDPMLEAFQPPASAAELDAAERALPGPLPEEVRAWFGWRNGLTLDRTLDYQLVPLGLPLGLAEAASTAETERTIAAEAAREFGLEEPLWDPAWLPLFHDRSDLLVVRCAPERAASSSVWIRESQSPEPELAYDSLRGLVGYAAECWETGAFRREDHGGIEEDRTRLPDIWRRWNPEAAEIHGGVPPLGVTAWVGPEAEEPDLARMLRQLTAADEAKRLEAVANLARAGHAAALEPALAFLKHRHGAIRWSAALYLGQLGDLAAVPGLVAALEDDVETVRMLAADALAAFGAGVGADARRALAFLAANDPDQVVRRVATDALARIDATG